jgi:hypothetical protein
LSAGKDFQKPIAEKGFLSTNNRDRSIFSPDSEEEEVEGRRRQVLAGGLVRIKLADTVQFYHITKSSRLAR